MKRNPWPYAIILYFVAFISGIVTWVVFATRHQDQLIRPDYYEHEIRYQEQIEKAKRASILDKERVFSFDPGSQLLVVQLSPAPNLAGKVHLYRPSDVALDREKPLKFDANGRAVCDLSDLKGGLWKASLTWSADGQEYFLERTIIARGL